MKGHDNPINQSIPARTNRKQFLSGLTGIAVALLMVPMAAQAGGDSFNQYKYGQLQIDYSKLYIPQIGAGTYFNGIEEVALGHSTNNVSGWGIGGEMTWLSGQRPKWWFPVLQKQAREAWYEELEDMSDDELFALMDKYEAMAKQYPPGEVPADITRTLNDLYDEDDWREYMGPPPGYGIRISFSYHSGDGDASSGIPFGGANVANTYITPDPISGSTGVFLGASGEDVRIHSKYEDFRLGVGLVNRSKLNADRVLETWPRISFGYIGLRQDVDLTSPSFSAQDFSSKVNYDVDENRFTLGYGFLFNQRYRKTLSFSLGGGIDVGYRDAQLDATQHNICVPCGGSEVDLTLNQKRNDSGLALDFDLSVGLNYRIAKRTLIDVSLGGYYSPNVAKVETKDNPSEELVLGTDSLYGWSAGIGLRHSF